PFTWSLPADGLPPGLNLSSAGVISGNPTTPGTFTFNVMVTDSKQKSDTESFTITVVPPPSITTASLDPGEVAVLYSLPLAATGGTTPLTWSWAAVSGSSLPAGLNLAAATG